MRLNTMKNLQISCSKEKRTQIICIGHEDFDEIMAQIQKKANFQHSLQAADDLYGIRKYNIMSLTPKRVKELYISICRRSYKRVSNDHLDEWIGYELKLFVWLLVCHLGTKISHIDQIEAECWEKYSRIFHNKNIQLIEYQAKLINCGQFQLRKWQKREQNFVVEIMRSTKKKAKWNEIAKDLYLKSGRCYFRNPKQIRERWLNHLDPQICKSEWSITEDHMIISTVLEKGRKWALIAKMGGCQRTQHMIKNRYYTLLRNQSKNNQQTQDKQKYLKSVKLKLEEIMNKEIIESFSSVKPLEVLFSSEGRKIESQICSQQQNWDKKEIQALPQMSSSIEDPVELEYYKWSYSEKTKNMEKPIELICFFEQKKYKGNLTIYDQAEVSDLGMLIL